MSKRCYPSLIGDCLSYTHVFVCSDVRIVKTACCKCGQVLQAELASTFSSFLAADLPLEAGQDQNSWQAQHLEHVMIKFRGRHST